MKFVCRKPAKTILEFITINSFKISKNNFQKVAHFFFFFLLSVFFFIFQSINWHGNWRRYNCAALLRLKILVACFKRPRPLRDMYILWMYVVFFFYLRCRHRSPICLAVHQLIIAVIYFYDVYHPF